MNTNDHSVDLPKESLTVPPSKKTIKELEKVKAKLQKFVGQFYKVCYFVEKDLDWNVISQQEYNRLKLSWVRWCESRKYGKEFKMLFHWDCMLLKTDLIMQSKYKCMAENPNELLAILKTGLKPLEAAKIANETLKTKKI